MKTTAKLLGVVVLGILTLMGCSKETASRSWSLDKSQASGQLKSYVAAQETQARTLAAKEGKALPPEFDAFYQAAAKGDWRGATNGFAILAKTVQGGDVRGAWWSATMDAYGVFELFPSGAEKYSIAFGREIISSIPEGGIYFGGTDPGRFVVTAMTESHADGKPFFVLTQNALADGTYLEYLRSMYDGKIYTPTAEDAQKCFSDYYTDAQKRLQNHQLNPGEDVKVDDNGKVQVSGQVAVMGINGLLAKVVFDKNPDREFYLEESFPLDWMYPYLEPHSLIMKINRQPLTQLSDETVQADSDYWSKYITPMIGNWLNNDTPVKDIAAFVEKVYAKQDLGGFTGDPQFLQSADAQKEFSKLRSSIAGLYAWRAQNTNDGSEKKRMNDAADFAYRQAWALCPYSPEAVFRYINLLMSQNRASDALLVAETAAKMPANAGQNGDALRQVITQLSQNKTQ